MPLEHASTSRASLSFAACTWLAGLGVAFVEAPAFAQTGAAPTMSVEHLQSVYLRCEDVAERRVLDIRTAAYCSTVAESLLQRGFGGDSERMRAWWQGMRRAATSPHAQSDVPSGAGLP